jgi:hypothetical protein
MKKLKLPETIVRQSLDDDTSQFALDVSQTQWKRIGPVVEDQRSNSRQNHYNTLVED